MATLVFSAAGTALAGPVGGAIGSLVGRQIDGALFASSRQGPRLRELDATRSTYGEVLPRHYGAMRVAGSLIWATELTEHSETMGTGKGSPSLSSYTYSASFAVALASRPIEGIGRIWADGKLLRGAQGDLKAGGTLRIHTGRGDQPLDPLLASAEGAQSCPAYRGLAYVVFEDLQLADFYNRIPGLTFEVFAGDTVLLQDILDDALEACETSAQLPELAGFSCSGPVVESLQALDAVFPLDTDASGENLLVRHESHGGALKTLGAASVPEDPEGFGTRSGFARSRGEPAPSPLALLRYYDQDRDYLPGVQRVAGRPAPGAPVGIDLPASLDAANAARLIHRAHRRAERARDTIAWRTTELDPAIAPGVEVRLPGHSGTWRVRAWEWCEAGVELELERRLPTATLETAPHTGSSGRYAPPVDLPLGETRLVAFELPLDAASAHSDAPRPHAAASSSSAGWPGAALYADPGTGTLEPLGATGRTRALLGVTTNALPPANSLLLDRSSALDVTLPDPAMVLSGANTAELAQGVNLALVGEELVQFAKADPIGPGAWRLSGFLRGLAGSEAGLAAHAPGEAFVLLDTAIRPLDAALLGSAAEREVVALGRGDAAPVRTSLHLDGITRRPLAPVHPRRTRLPDGTVRFTWTRRARGAWRWADTLDVPLVEETEIYLLTLGDPEQPLASWQVLEPRIEISPATIATLGEAAITAPVRVRQAGTHALSPALLLGTLEAA
ncbi:MAG: phage tail protein [Pseudomonadota bacterium]|nr:phage tail protein [Pseudomonadota bacterium]